MGPDAAGNLAPIVWGLVLLWVFVWLVVGCSCRSDRCWQLGCPCVGAAGNLGGVCWLHGVKASTWAEGALIQPLVEKFGITEATSKNQC